MAFWFLQVSFDFAAVFWMVLSVLSRSRLRVITEEAGLLRLRLESIEEALRALKTTERETALHSSQPPVTTPSTLSTQRVEASAMPESPGKVLNSPLGSAISTLSEKNMNGTDFSGVDAYEKADLLFSRGLSMNEVVRQTGLSLSELQLLRKMAGRNQ